MNERPKIVDVYLRCLEHVLDRAANAKDPQDVRALLKLYQRLARQNLAVFDECNKANDVDNAKDEEKIAAKVKEVEQKCNEDIAAVVQAINDDYQAHPTSTVQNTAKDNSSHEEEVDEFDSAEEESSEPTQDSPSSSKRLVDDGTPNSNRSSIEREISETDAALEQFEKEINRGKNQQQKQTGTREKPSKEGNKPEPVQTTSLAEDDFGDDAED